MLIGFCLLVSFSQDFPLLSESTQYNNGKTPFKNEFVFDNQGNLSQVYQLKIIADSTDTVSGVEYFYNKKGQDSLQNIFYGNETSHRQLKFYNSKGLLKKIEYLKNDSVLSHYDSLFYKGDTQLTQIKTYSGSSIKHIKKFSYLQEKLLSEFYYEVSDSGELLKQLKLYKYNSENKISLIEHRKVLEGIDMFVKSTRFQYFEGEILWITNAWEFGSERQLIDSSFFEGAPKEGIVKTYFFNSDKILEYISTQEYDNSSPVRPPPETGVLQFKFANGLANIITSSQEPLHFYVFDVRGRVKFTRLVKGATAYSFRLAEPLNHGLYFAVIKQGKKSLNVKFSHF